MGFRVSFIALLGVLVSAALVSMPFLFPLDGEGGTDLVAGLGRFHILVLHFPICLLLIVPVLEVLGSFSRWAYLKDTARFILFLAVLFAVKACVLGYMLALGDGSAGELLNDHMWASILTTVFMILAFVLREAYMDTDLHRAQGLYVLVLGISMVSLTVGSHHGASLVHGEDFLVARLPESIKSRLGIQEQVVEPLTYDSMVYSGLIQPILEQNCYSCHSDAKQKGQLRLDDIDHMLAGGKSKEAGLTPGYPAESKLFSRISLARTDKKVMPPPEEPALTHDQISLIRWWIEGGASADQTIDDLAYEFFPKDIEDIVSALVSRGDSLAKPLTWSTFASVSEQVKKDYGIDVIRHSQELNDGVYVVTRNATNAIPAQAFKDMEPIAPHVTSINLWRRTLEEGAIAEIAGFANLQSLHLNETNVSTNELAALTGLRSLKMLNLHGTAIGDGGVDTLRKLRSLRRLHLQGTEISESGIESLASALKRCEVLVFVEPEEEQAEEVEEDTIPVPDSEDA